MMARISFVKNKAPIHVETGANLMKSLLAAGIPVASSCKGDGVCCKCVIEILEGHEHLSLQSKQEMQLRERNQLGAKARVSCQTQVFGDIKIDTGYW